ncbi:hypothetical protein [Pedobacter heparinus]|uniref:hypothetical protein n=1 Tax=Pedobacter heparinus TaxID=984 RepID=UPI00292CD741|nr:hypothetical protein [Pedobacter heparinus]
MNNIRLGELKGVFDDLEAIFEKMDIDFYLIGAMARQVWYAGSGRTQRTTQDVDFPDGLFNSPRRLGIADVYLIILVD